MSLKKRHVWAMMPLLGILLMSPKDVEIKYGRAIASDEPAPTSESAQVVVSSQTPKLDALLKDVVIPERQNPVNLNVDMLKEDISKLLSRAERAEVSYDRNTVQKPKLEEVRAELKASAIELRQVENSIKDLLNPEDEGDIRARIDVAEIRLEATLQDLSESETFLAQREATPVETQTEPAAQIAQTQGPDRSPSVVSSEPVEKDPILCALEEQNKLLQQQLQMFMQQQGLIMQQLMQLSQMVMLQGMYRTPDTFNYQNVFPYQYAQSGQGNWVYYPNGVQPMQQQQPQMADQSNIFSMQPYGQMPMMGGYGMGMGGMYGQPQMQQPQMMGQPGQWGLAPQMDLQQPAQNLGMSAGMGYNVGQFGS